jgi:hypothetical protein
MGIQLGLDLRFVKTGGRAGKNKNSHVSQNRRDMGHPAKGMKP